MSQMKIFTEEYLGKIFYFSLKKTGNEQDAAELASDISFEIIQALKKGREPENLNAWIWTIARNRWSKWAVKNYYKSPDTVDIDDYEMVLPSEQDIENTIVRTEDQDYIHWELAFIRSDYRMILVAHYFDEMSVSEISRNFHIPLGTVKTKLQSSRKILKEGMDMARKFGTRSFRPETIYFCASGNQPTDLPHCAVTRKIPVNILCEANNNPSTIEELSMELGIAVPYMEEEVKLLEDSELLRKVEKEKYLTSIFIAPRESQNEVAEITCNYAEKMYGTMWKLAGMVVQRAEDFGIDRSGISEIDAQMFFALRMEQHLELSILPDGIFMKFERKDGGNWGFMGREAGAVCRLPQVGFDNNGQFWNDLRWDGFQTYDSSFGKPLYKYNTPDHGPLGLGVLRKIARRIPIDTFSESEQQELECEVTLGFCKKTDQGDYQVQALCFAEDTEGKVAKYLDTLNEYHQLYEDMKKYLGQVKEIIARYSVEALKDDFEYYVAMSSQMRGVIAGLWKDKGLYTGDSTQFSVIWR